MPYIVAKFGGSSLASSQQFAKVRDIVLQDTRRKYIVASAPGKRFSQDRKITDLLLDCFFLRSENKDFLSVFNIIANRFIDIRNELDLKLDIETDLDCIKRKIIAGASQMYIASRGEYLCAKLLAEYVGYTFFDPVNAVFFSDDCAFNAERSNRTLAEQLDNFGNAVMPGFYGAFSNGDVCTFSRGGSDISGAIVARAICADVYENWTDVSGFFITDPSVVANPLEIQVLSYKELRELRYMQAGVLHEDAIYPVQKAGIITNIRNTNNPKHPGTLIVNDDGDVPVNKNIITGIAGKAGFDILRIDKSTMESETGVAMRLMQVFAENNIQIEQIVSSIAQISVVLQSNVLADLECRERVLVRIKELIQPHNINIDSDIALLAIVGRYIRYSRDSEYRIFNALYRSNIAVHAILQNNSQISTIVAISADELSKAINTIYNEFVLGDKNGSI